METTIHMKSLYILLTVVLFTSCSSSHTDKVPEKFDTNSQKGIAVGTLTFDADMPKNDIYRFFYEPVSTTDKKFIRKNKGKVMVKARIKNDRGFNGDFNDKKTYLFVIEADPGQYAFIDYAMLNHIGEMGTMSFSRPFSIPFEVKKGEIAYIGELTYHQEAGQDEPKISVSDNFDRDINELKTKFPAIDWNKSYNKTVKAGENANCLIEFKQ